MRILQVIHRFPLTGGAGAENYTRHLSNALSKKHDILIVTRDSPEYIGDIYCNVKDLSGYPYPVKAFVNHPRDFNIISKNYWNTDLNKPFSQIIEQFNPDIVHYQHVLGLSISLIDVTWSYRIPIVCTLHDYWLLCPNIVMLNSRNKICHQAHILKCWFCHFKKYPGLQTSFSGLTFFLGRNKRIKDSFNKCDLILCPSRTLLTKVSTLGFNKKKLIYWPHGIPQNPSVVSKTNSNVLHTPVRFGYIGTFSYQKGIDILIKAFMNLPSSVQAELVVWGGTPEQINDISVEAMKKSRRIIFPGRFKLLDTWKVHSEIDVLVVPSRWHENRPLTILESFRMGNPVLGTRIGGVFELISPLGSFWTFPLNDISHLQRKIIQISENPSYILKARQLIPDVPDMNTECQKLIHIYQTLIKKKRGSSSSVKVSNEF